MQHFSKIMAFEKFSVVEMISARPLIVIADYGSNKDKFLPMVRSSTGYSSIISKYTVMKSKNVNFLYSFTY